MTFDSEKWACASEILFWKGSPKTAVFFNTYSGDGVTTPWNGLLFTRGQWTRVDLSEHIPLDAKAVNLGGLLIITHGNQQETANLTLNVKPPSSNENPANYEGQVIEVWTGGGQRTNFATWVAVEDAKFDFYWNVNQLGTYPEFSSYGINLNIVGFAR